MNVPPVYPQLDVQQLRRDVQSVLALQYLSRLEFVDDFLKASPRDRSVVLRAQRGDSLRFFDDCGAKSESLEERQPPEHRSPLADLRTIGLVGADDEPVPD